MRPTFDALSALGIESVVVTFDGCGDSGQIDDIAVNGGKGAPSGAVNRLVSLNCGAKTPVPRTRGADRPAMELWVA